MNLISCRFIQHFYAQKHFGGVGKTVWVLRKNSLGTYNLLFEALFFFKGMLFSEGVWKKRCCEFETSKEGIKKTPSRICKWSLLTYLGVKVYFLTSTASAS